MHKNEWVASVKHFNDLYLGRENYVLRISSEVLAFCFIM